MKYTTLFLVILSTFFQMSLVRGFEALSYEKRTTQNKKSMDGYKTALPVKVKKIDLDHPENIEGIDIFLSFPRSGRTWTMQILQIVLGKGMISFKSEIPNVFSWVLEAKVDIDLSKPPLYHSHYVRPFLRKIDQQNNKVFAIIRNYKECLVRHHKFSPYQLRKCILNNEEPFRQYIDILSFYNCWEIDESKHLMYYEELIAEHERVVTELFDFLGEDKESLDDFFDNYDYWSQLAISAYRNYHNSMPSSGGDKKVFHTKDFPIELLREIDEHVKKTYPDLWEKYLSRYAS